MLRKRCLIDSLVFLLTVPICFLVPSHAGQSSQVTGLGLNQHRIDYRDLGYAPGNLIEADNSKITSLITHPENGIVFGATSGKKAALFCFSPQYNHVRPLGYLPSGEGVHNALALAGDGMLYIGTGKDMTLEVELPRAWETELGTDHIVKTMWRNLKAEYSDYSAGRLFRFDPRRWAEMQYHADRKAEVEDLGSPVSGEGIYGLTASGDGKSLYGITYPSGHFFVFDIASSSFKDLGETWDEVIYAGPRKGLRTLPGQLVSGKDGACYFSVDRGRLVRYEPDKDQIVRLNAFIPGDFYPVHNDFETYHPAVECWTAGADGAFYGGTNEGYLFRLSTDELEITNLGKIRTSRRIRGLATGRDGRVWGIAGEDRIGCTLFCYDPEKGGFQHLGPLQVDRSPYYAWYPLRFDSATAGLDGTIYLGESDRKGHLYLIMPTE